MWTFILIVISGAFTVIFSSYWFPSVKKFFSVPSIRVFLPLIGISWLVVVREAWVDWGFNVAAALFHYLIYSLNDVLPGFPGKIGYVKAVYIAGISLIPTFYAWVIAKPFRPFKPPYWASVYLFILLMSMVVSF